MGLTLIPFSSDYETSLGVFGVRGSRAVSFLASFGICLPCILRTLDLLRGRGMARALRPHFCNHPKNAFILIPFYSLFLNEVKSGVTLGEWWCYLEGLYRNHAVYWNPILLRGFGTFWSIWSFTPLYCKNSIARSKTKTVQYVVTLQGQICLRSHIL